MTETPLDPRHARLVALLYDELPTAEAAALRDELARDSELRGDWIELQETRRFLGAWDVEERTPSFVFIEPPAVGRPGAAPVTPHPEVSRLPVTAGMPVLRRNLGRFAAFSGWALAATAFLVFGIAGKGLRVERLEDGFSLRLGHGAVEEPILGAGGDAPENHFAAASFSHRPGAPVPNVAAGGDSFVSVRELDAHTEQMMELFGRVISEDRARQQREFTSLVRGIYGDLNERQFAGYRDLRGRIDAVDVGLKLGQSGTIRNPDGTTAPAIVDTLEATKDRPRQPRQRGWRLGDFPNEPERP